MDYWSVPGCDEDDGDGVEADVFLPDDVREDEVEVRRTSSLNE